MHGKTEIDQKIVSMELAWIETEIMAVNSQCKIVKTDLHLWCMDLKRCSTKDNGDQEIRVMNILNWDHLNDRGQDSAFMDDNRRTIYDSTRIGRGTV